MQIVTNPLTTSGRARPLSVEDRQAMIIDAVIPLLAEHGLEVTSKQIAEAAGVAEGTIFRAFGDKETLIRAAIARFLDPEPLRRELRRIDPELDLHTKVISIITLMQRRFHDVFRIMAIVGHERPSHTHQRKMFADIIAEVLAPDLEKLAWPADRVAHIIRLVTFASSVPHFNDGMEFTPAELASIILHGILHHTHPTESQD
ncbi:TetR/AcrR family transcriptional regulator [Leifsonia bigeumensis]|uniref:TetR/AcrR family transcriptional regulator n=1 Tax=Leifsonella bigeumensis TaxID=433643 RepID=A0ABP7FT73_9MICO